MQTRGTDLRIGGPTTYISSVGGEASLAHAAACAGMLVSGGRRSIEPTAARVHPQDVRSGHPSMHQLVADSERSDATVLGAVAHSVVLKEPHPESFRREYVAHYLATSPSGGQSHAFSDALGSIQRIYLTNRQAAVPEHTLVVAHDEALGRTARLRLPRIANQPLVERRFATIEGFKSMACA